MKSLLKSIDQFFFGTSDEGSEIKPYFYVSLLVGVILSLVVVAKLF